MNLSTKTPPASKLILEPTWTFAAIAEELARLGWQQQPNTITTPSILPDEPELAAWKNPYKSGRIVYTFNPVVYLRVLCFYGNHAREHSDQVVQQLPTLGLQDLNQLLQSHDIRQLLLGLFAASELEALPTLNLITQLQTHPEPRVAQTAAQVHQKLLPLALSTGAQHLAQEKANHPDRSVLFPHLGDARQRRQILRWLIHDHSEANDHILATLR